MIAMRGEQPESSVEARIWSNLATTDEANEPAVSLRGLTKTFGALRAVDDLNLEIRRGETVALLGPNGAGKSTTISMLLGLLAPDGGSASVLGMPAAAAVQAGRIGAMLQEGSLMPGVRVGELLDFALGLRPSGAGITREHLLTTAGLAGLERRRVDRLSGGQTQRLRFALAIASQPEVLVLDEPTAAMDVEARHAFWANMRTYASAGRTVLFATHYLEEAEAFASRVVVLAHGRIVADGTVEELKQTVSLRTVRFRSADAPYDALARLPGVRQVALDGAAVTLRTGDADATVRGLVGGGIAWREIEVQSANLEDVFMKLVGRGAADANGGN
jgi:ABC-2 type transport system ATP-binding protein